MYCLIYKNGSAAVIIKMKNNSKYLGKNKICLSHIEDIKTVLIYLSSI